MKSTNIITLLTDFGMDDEYVGVMKGVILSVNPHAKIIDITHRIDAQDLGQAAYMLESAYKYFPEGTVHVVVVDPGVGSGRAIVAVKTGRHVFLAPDNGVLSLVLDSENPDTDTPLRPSQGGISDQTSPLKGGRRDVSDSIIRVENADYFLDSVSQTFHGRDIFAPVAAHISKGLDIAKLGKPALQSELTRLALPKSYLTDSGELIGTIVSVDRFGNLITNIDARRLERFRKAGTEKKLEIHLGKHKITDLVRSYARVEPGSPLAIVGSRGYLEISVNCGNAAAYFMAEKGDNIRFAWNHP